MEIGQRHALPAFSTLGHWGLLLAAAVRVDLPAVRRRLHQVQELAAHYQYTQLLDTTITGQVWLAHVTGDLDRAEREIQGVAEAMHRHGDINADTIAPLALVCVRLSQDRLAEIEPVARALEQNYPGSASDLLALVLARTGRAEEARRVAARSAGPLREDYLRSLLLTVRARAVVALDQRDQAAQVYQDLLPFAGGLAGGVTAAFIWEPVDTALGELALLLGRIGPAGAHFAAGRAAGSHVREPVLGQRRPRRCRPGLQVRLQRITSGHGPGSPA